MNQTIQRTVFLVAFFLIAGFIGPSCQSVPKLTAEKPLVSVIEENEELSEKERQSWLQGRKNYLKSLYQEKLDPYFGKSDQAGSCESKSVRPLANKVTPDFSYASYSILTTDAGATGVCDPQMQTHQMILVFAACANRPLQYTLKVICPVAAIHRSLSCEVSEQQIDKYCYDRKFSEGGL